jgi:uncharacterized membrane protein
MLSQLGEFNNRPRSRILHETTHGDVTLTDVTPIPHSSRKDFATMQIWNVLHTLAAIIWVGGMFFSFMVLRPATAILAPKQRLALWKQTLALFFRWVAVAIIVIFATGYLLIYQLGGFAAVGTYVHLMHGLAWLMLIVFKVILFWPYRNLSKAIERDDTAAAALSMGRMRLLIAGNLALGLIIVIAASGKFPA